MIAYERNLLDTGLPLDSARIRFLVSPRARQHIADAAVPSLIRTPSE
jgi:hypothetical protein